MSVVKPSKSIKIPSKSSIDIAVVDQFSGPTTKCDWIEYGELPINDSGKKIACCWLFEGRRMGEGLHFREDTEMSIATPSWWEPSDCVMDFEHLTAPPKGKVLICSEN